MGNEDHSSPESQEAKNRLKEVMDSSLGKGAKKEKAPKSGNGIDRKKAGIIAAAAVLLLGLGFAGFALTGDSDDDVAEEPQQVEQQEERIINLAAAAGLVEGTVEKSVDGETWTVVEAAETINVGESVRTGEDSRAVLVLDDGSAVRLDANTEMKLMTSDANGTEVMLVDGQVYSRVIPSETRSYAVATVNERFTAQGTAYTTKTDGEKDEIKVLESKVLVDSEEIEVDEGNEYDSDTKEEKEIDLDELKDDEFVKWNKEQDEGDDKYKDSLGVLDVLDKKEEETDNTPSTPEPAPAPSAGISLSGSTSDKGVKLSWSLTGGATAPDGFKVVYDKGTTSPVYKTHASQYAGKDSRSTTVNLDDGSSYNFRVCLYRASSSSCDTYSNSVKVTAPKVELEEVQSGVTELEIDGDVIEWGITGTAPHGFKILLSSSQNPTYPSNSIEYAGDEVRSTELPDKAAGTYYVRVCKYTGSSSIDNGCTDYSNQVEYVVD